MILLLLNEKCVLSQMFNRVFSSKTIPASFPQLFNQDFIQADPQVTTGEYRFRDEPGRCHQLEALLNPRLVYYLEDRFVSR